MSYAFGSLAQNGGDDSSGQSDIMSMSDQELDAYIEARYGDQLNLDTDMLLAECGGCMAQDRMHRAYFAGDATEADLMGMYRAQGAGAITGLSLMGPGGFTGATYLGARVARLWSRGLGPGSRLFGNTFYRGKGNAGLLNHGNIRVGWSFDKAAGRVNFTGRIGDWHLDRVWNPISIRPPRRPFK